MTGGQLLVESLVRHGVEVVFGIPGAHTMAIYDALYRHPKIKHILVRHEQSAALMADGYARATGKVGVCCVTTGPGVTNASTGLAVAQGDSIPVLLISSQVHSGAAKKRRGLFHAMDQLALTKSITKWNGRADNPAQIPERIGEALHVLSSGRRGAGHLEVPLDILQQDFELKGLTPPVKRVPSPAEIRNSTADIRRAAQLLRQSKRPLIFAGGGVIAAEAWQAEGVVARSSWMPNSARPQKRIDVGPASRPPVDWWELREILERDAIVAADIARSGYALVGQFPVYEPRTFMHSASFIAMGHAFPAALGAKVAFPGRQVVSVSGDGCFMMTGQELATAVQHGINVVAIVINDRCLTGIAALQDSQYNGRRVAVDLVNPDFVRYAESFGALGFRVRQPEEFKPALQKALEAE